MIKFTTGYQMFEHLSDQQAESISGGDLPQLGTSISVDSAGNLVVTYTGGGTTGYNQPGVTESGQPATATFFATFTLTPGQISQSGSGQISGTLDTTGSSSYLFPF